jgi:predicted kinase
VADGLRAEVATLAAAVEDAYASIVDELPAGFSRKEFGPGLVRVNRDDLRRMLHGGVLGTGTAERQVMAAQRAAVEALLRAGTDVVCDDTNLRSRVVRELADLAAGCGAEVVVRDFTEVPVDECVRRDAGREPAARVGAEVIRGMWQRYLAGRALPLPYRRRGRPWCGCTTRRPGFRTRCWWTSTGRWR